MPLRALSLLILAVVGVACGGPAPTPSPAPTSSPSPSPSPTPSGPLLTIESRGGRCVDGPCGNTLIVELDGRVHQAAKPPNDLGYVEPDLLAELQQAIADADFDAIRSVPFTGTCPIAYDGQEIVVDFGTDHGVEHFEGCQTAIDWASPPFSTIKLALAPWFAN